MRAARTTRGSITALVVLPDESQSRNQSFNFLPLFSFTKRSSKIFFFILSSIYKKERNKFVRHRLSDTIMTLIHRLLTFLAIIDLSVSDVVIPFHQSRVNVNVKFQFQPCEFFCLKFRWLVFNPFFFKPHILLCAGSTTL